MAHKHNIKAFQVGTKTSEKLLKLYSSLVVIELTIKDNLRQKQGTWPGIRHDIKRGIDDLFPDSDPLPDRIFSPQPAIINQLKADTGKLETDLRSLYCTGASGLSQEVRITSYPDIRYLRHNSDDHNEHSGETTEESLDNALATVQSIISGLIKLSLLSGE